MHCPPSGPQNGVHYGSFSTFPVEIRHKVDVLSVSDVLDTPSSNDIAAVQKAKTLYRSCINESKCLLAGVQRGELNLTQRISPSQAAAPRACLEVLLKTQMLLFHSHSRMSAVK